MISSESMIAFEDVTRATVYFSAKDIHDLVLALPPEKRRYTKLMAATVKEPQEIWQCWVRDEEEAGKWEKVRSYLCWYQFLPSDSRDSHVFAIVQFTYRQRWQMRRLDVLVGEEVDLIPEIDKLYRVGSMEYPRVGGS